MRHGGPDRGFEARFEDVAAIDAEQPGPVGGAEHLAVAIGGFASTGELGRDLYRIAEAWILIGRPLGGDSRAGHQQ
jgi:hypothetical protein